MLSADQRKLLTTGVLVVAGCALAWYFLVDHGPSRPQPQVAQLKGMEAKEKKQPVRAQEATEEPEGRPLPPPQPVVRPQMLNLPPLPARNPTLATVEPELAVEEEVEPLEQMEPAISLPVARLALGFVGADPQAEELWYAAINDPLMPADARKDLIEDLNEDGFDDPRHVTEDDLPLIYSRIAIIEQVAPDAMDEVNAAAFAEAYKDLVNMVLRLEQEAIAREEAREEAQAQGQDITGGPPRRPLRGR